MEAGRKRQEQDRKMDVKGKQAAMVYSSINENWPTGRIWGKRVITTLERKTAVQNQSGHDMHLSRTGKTYRKEPFSILWSMRRISHLQQVSQDLAGLNQAPEILLPFPQQRGSPQLLGLMFRQVIFTYSLVLWKYVHIVADNKPHWWNNKLFSQQHLIGLNRTIYQSIFLPKLRGHPIILILLL